MSAGPAEAVRGDWDGSQARAQETAAAQLVELQRQVRAAYLDVIEHRDRWSHGVTAEDRVRAVAYQTCASRLLRIIDTQRHDQPAVPEIVAEPLKPVDVDRYAAADPQHREPRPLGWLFRHRGGPA